MFLFLMLLLVVRATPDTPGIMEDTQAISSDLDAENCRSYATAYYWDMYGALAEPHNANISGGAFCRPLDVLVSCIFTD